jgi:hypothetical protein
MWEEAVLVYFELLFLNLSRGSEEHKAEPQSGDRALNLECLEYGARVKHINVFTCLECLKHFYLGM